MCMCWRNDAYLHVCLSLLSPILSTILSVLLYFLTSTVCIFLCFNLCSTFEYCYRYQRFTNKRLLLIQFWTFICVLLQFNRVIPSGMISITRHAMGLHVQLALSTKIMVYLVKQTFRSVIILATAIPWWCSETQIIQPWRRKTIFALLVQNAQ